MYREEGWSKDSVGVIDTLGGKDRPGISIGCFLLTSQDREREVKEIGEREKKEGGGEIEIERKRQGKQRERDMAKREKGVSTTSIGEKRRWTIKRRRNDFRRSKEEQLI